MRSSFLSIAFALVATASSAAVPNTHVVHEKRDFTPSRWVKRERISPDVVLPLRIALKQRNLHQGYDLLMDVSHPQSANYAKHWTPDEVNEMFSPHQETVESVYTWLLDFGIDPGRMKHSNNKGWISLELTTEEAEGLLHTEYHLFESDEGQITPACDSYHVPSHIQPHIDYVTPGISLLAPRKKSIQKRTWNSGSELARRTLNKRIPKSLQTCDSVITPECIRALYGIPKTPEYQGGPRSDNALGIAEFGDVYAQEDLDLFFANFTPYIPEGTGPTPVLIDGSTAPTNVTDAGGESDLDFDLAYPLIWPQNITLFQAYPFLNNLLDAVDGTYCNYTAFNETGDDPSIDEPTLNGEEQCGTSSPTKVLSISYGEVESDLPANYQERQCNEFMKLGLQGITIIFASGDSGVADRDGSCLGDNSTIFNPGYPVNCPFVTTVGATKVYSGQTVYDPESAANDPDIGYSSGGGFSNIYNQPSYQQEAVAAYFADYDPGLPSYSGNASFGENGGVYNSAGRAYPDVSANGDNIATVNEGEYGLNGGTSASTPIFASLINRINEQRLNANKSTVGFINPALYSNPSMLNDITNGTNLGCNFSPDAFSAVPGWDPVTGLGTPNYPRMVEFFLSLP